MQVYPETSHHMQHQYTLKTFQSNVLKVFDGDPFCKEVVLGLFGNQQYRREDFDYHQDPQDRKQAYVVIRTMVDMRKCCLCGSVI